MNPRNVKAALRAADPEVWWAIGLILLPFAAIILSPVFEHVWKVAAPLLVLVFVGAIPYGLYRSVTQTNFANLWKDFKVLIADCVKMVRRSVCTLVFLALAVWLYMVFDSPQSGPAPGELAQAGYASLLVKGLLFRRMKEQSAPSTDGSQKERKYINHNGVYVLNPNYLPDNADFRLEQHKGFNLDIWVYQRDLEAIPYPDRKPFIESIGTTWCDAPGLKDQHTLLPSVAVRDMRTGKELASYSCLLSRAELK